MAKPKSKVELLAASQNNYKMLMDLVNSFSAAAVEKEFPAGTMNRNIRDVLGHLNEWHLMLLDWYEVGMKGEKPAMPAKGHTWKTLPDLNKEIWKSYQNVDLKTVKERLDKSFTDVQQLINKHSNEELFEKKKYKWTGTTSLGVYLISNTSSHYNWGIQVISKSTRLFNESQL